MTNNNQPFYKKLFEKITKGEETRVTEWNEITFSRPGIVESRKSLCQVSDFGKTGSEATANAEYLRLAWENLHILAEALERAKAWNETVADLADKNILDVKNLAKNSQLIISVISEALNRIS